MPQVLLLVKGLPGCGKSTLARQLAARLGWPLIDKDDARDCFQTVAASAPQVDWNSLSYAVMYRQAATQLGLGLCVVLDCPFARPHLYDQAADLAQQHGAAVVLLDVTCSDEALWRQRVEARGTQDAGTERGHKPCSWQELQAILQRYQGSWRWSCDGSVALPHRLELDTATSTPGQALQAVLQYLTDRDLLRAAVAVAAAAEAAPRQAEGEAGTGAGAGAVGGGVQGSGTGAAAMAQQCDACAADAGEAGGVLGAPGAGPGLEEGRR